MEAMQESVLFWSGYSIWLNTLAKMKAHITSNSISIPVGPKLYYQTENHIFTSFIWYFMSPNLILSCCHELPGYVIWCYFWYELYGSAPEGIVELYAACIYFSHDIYTISHFYGLVQERCNFSVVAMELRFLVLTHQFGVSDNSRRLIM